MNPVSHGITWFIYKIIQVIDSPSIRKSVYLTTFLGSTGLGRVCNHYSLFLVGPKYRGEVGKPEKIFPQLLSGDSVLLTQHLGHGWVGFGEMPSRLAGLGWKTCVLASSLEGISISYHVFFPRGF